MVAFLPDAGGGGLDPDEWGRASLASREAAELLGLPEGTVPGAGSGPADVAAWWAGLSAEQRELMLAAYPDQIGALDGLPVAARDRANRLWLRERIGKGEGPYLDPNAREQKRLVSLLAKLEAADFEPPERRLYLLGLDNEGDGRAIVSVGNPDMARHTAVLVPGVNTNLDGMGGQMGRAASIQRTADQLTLGVDGDVAVVAWLGYDPPQMDASVVLAAGSGRAEAAAGPLDRFVDGLRAAHEPGVDHITAIGHSYGSVVVGNAASGDHHLAVDDIVTAGSPGMDVDRAAELNVGARHVWAGAAPDDPVASPDSYLAGRWGPARLGPGGAGRCRRRCLGARPRHPAAVRGVRRQRLPRRHPRPQRLLGPGRAGPAHTELAQPGQRRCRPEPGRHVGPWSAAVTVGCRILAATAAVLLVMVAGGCSGGRDDKEDRPLQTMRQADAVRMAKTYADTTASTLDSRVENWSAVSMPCEIRGGDLATDGRWRLSGHAQIRVPEDQHAATLRRLRDLWAGQDYQITEFRLFPPDNMRGRIIASNPADGVSVSLQSTVPPQAFAVLILTPCYLPAAGEHPAE